MRRITFLLLAVLYCFTTSGIGNAPQIDSLKNLIAQTSGSEKLELLNELASYYQNLNSEKAYEISKGVFNEARSSGNKEIMAEALLNIGKTFSLRGNYQAAIHHFDTALQQYWEMDDTAGQIWTMKYLGDNYFHQNRYADAFDFYIRSRRLSEQQGNEEGLFRINTAIGKLYLETGSKQKALAHFERALQIAQEKNRQELIASGHENMGIYFYTTGRNVEAIESLNKALYLYTLIDNKRELSHIYVHIGEYYIKTGNLKMALSNFQKALQLCLEANCILPEGRIYTKISQVYQLMGNHHKSLEYNRKALQANMDYGNTAELSGSHLNIGSSFTLMGEYDSAYNYYLKGIETAKTIGHQRYIRDGYKSLYNLSLIMNDYREALGYLEKYINLKEEIESREKSEEIAELRAKYDLHDQQMLNELQQLKMERQQDQLTILVFGIVLFVILLAFIYFLYLNKKRSNTHITRINEELEEKFHRKTIELRRQESLFQNLVEQIPMGVYRTLPSGQIEFANAALINMLGFNSLQELQGLNLEKQSPEMKQTRQAFKEKMQKEGEVKSMESLWRKADGSSLNVSEYARAVRDENGKILYYEGVVEDITIRKNAEKALKEALESAKESDRLKTAFLSTMQHELRTPLNSILGFSEILADNENLDNTSQEYMKLINESGHQLLSIINDILDITTITAGKVKLNKKSHNINKSIQEVYADYAEKINKSDQKSELILKMHRPLGDSLATIEVDPHRLKQVLSNLLDNALKFTYEGEIHLGYELARDKQIRFFVSDNGIGIPRSKLSIIFEQFRQVEDTDTRQFGGSGLGLAICKSLVEIMGGEIDVESQPGKGSVFSFTIPYDKDLTAIRKEQPNEVSELITHRYNWDDKNILIAEDNFANFYLLKTYLKHTGMHITHAKNGEEALEHMGSGSKFDLVLMDIQLPGINGYDTTRKIRENNPEVPVIAVTAYTNDKDREKCLQAGCNDYIPKPISKEALFEKMARFLS